MGKYKDAKALYKQLPDHHPLKIKYGDNFSRRDFRDMGRSLDAISDALMRSEFDKQMAEVDEREALWEETRNKINNLLENTPEYWIPQVIKELKTKLPEIANQIKTEYVNAGNKLESITDEKLTSILSNVTEGLDKQLQVTQEGVGDLEEGVSTLKDIYGEGAEGIEKYGEEGLEYGREGLDKIRETSEKGMEAFQAGRSKIEKEYGEGVQKFENIYGRLASRTTMPGEDILKEQLSAQRESLVQRIKEYGDGSSEGLMAVAGAYENEQEQLRNMAIERANYLTGAQRDYANALFQGAGARAGMGERMLDRESQQYQNLADIYGYTTELGMSQNELRASQAERAAMLRGRAEELGLEVGERNLERLIDAERYKTEMGYSTGMEALSTELDVTNQAAMLRAMGYEQEADRLLQNTMIQADYRDRAYELNKLMPWQTKMQYYMGAEQQYDPFAERMSVLGDEAGYSWAQISSMAERRQQNKEMWMNLLGQGLEGLAAVAGVVGGGGAPSGGGEAPFGGDGGGGAPASD